MSSQPARPLSSRPARVTHVQSRWDEVSAPIDCHYSLISDLKFLFLGDRFSSFSCASRGNDTAIV